MSPEQERYSDAKTRMADLDHAVAEDEAAVRRSPGDRGAVDKLEMTLKIRQAAKEALDEAQQALQKSQPPS